MLLNKQSTDYISDNEEYHGCDKQHGNEYHHKAPLAAEKSHHLLHVKSLRNARAPHRHRPRLMSPTRYKDPVTRTTWLDEASL